MGKLRLDRVNLGVYGQADQRCSTIAEARALLRRQFRGATVGRWSTARRTDGHGGRIVYVSVVAWFHADGSIGGKIVRTYSADLEQAQSAPAAGCES